VLEKLKTEPSNHFSYPSLLQPWPTQDDVHAIKDADNSEDLTFLTPRLDEQIWTGSMDPFLRYPIELSDRTRELVNLDKSSFGSHLTCPYITYPALDDRYVKTRPFRHACLPVGPLDAATSVSCIASLLL